MPKEYRSRLSIIENGRTAVQKDVLVNHPLRYKGVNIFQSSYGELPPEVAITSAPEEIALSFTSKETGMVYNKKVRIGERIKVPEGLGEFEIKAFKPTHDFRGRDLGPTLIGTLVQADGVPAEVILPFKFPGFDRMSTMTDPQRSDALMIALEEMPSPNDPQAKRFYTGLQVTKDPGVGAVYTGFVLMIIGCIVTFFMSHQRLCIEVTRGGKQSRVTVSGNANKNRFGMRKKVGAITGHLLEVDGGLQNTPVSTGQNTTGNSP
jgi:cytochrome c biogenesis protein